PTRVIEVRVSQHDGVERGERALLRDAVRVLETARALEHPAIDEDVRGPGLDEVRGAGHLAPRRAVHADLHRSSSSVNRLMSIYRGSAGSSARQSSPK